MRRIFYNMQYGGAYGAAYRLNAPTKKVKSADIATLHRLHQPWQPRGFDDQTAHLVEMPPNHAMIFAVAQSIVATIPPQVSHRPLIGPVILSPWPIVKHSVYLLRLWVQLD